jgi:hypothetical protein
MNHPADLLSHLLSVVAVIGIAAFASPALAQTRPLTPDMQAALETCRPDIERLCPGVAPGDGRIMACMREHRSEIRQACRAAILSAAAAGGTATEDGG